VYEECLSTSTVVVSRELREVCVHEASFIKYECVFVYTGSSIGKATGN
jgi:hypothetical protein